MIRKSVALLAVFAMALVSFTAPSSANLADEINQANEAASTPVTEEMSDVDVATADIDSITEQLKTLNKQVTLAEAKTEKLESEMEFLDEQSDDFETDIQGIQDDIDQLEVDLSDRAIDSFKNQSDNSVIIIETDPSDSIRMQKLSSSARKNEIETAEELRQKKADLAATELAKDELKEKLSADAEENKESLAKYESARVSFAKLAEDAQDRADRTLSEAEGLEGADKAKADELRAKVEALSEQITLALKDEIKKLEAEAAANPEAFAAAIQVRIEGTVTDAEIVPIPGTSIRVHRDIASNVTRMISAAAAAGITLDGGGYRSNASQIAVRKNNCGTSSYAIYQMPSSSCRPPTARPGSSQHEKGLAIDFTSNGSTLRAGSPGYVWLQNNAALYGLINFPRESWHWSTTGR